MALRKPTDQDLHRLAQENNFQLTDEELQSFQALMPGLFESFETLDRMPLPKEPLKYPSRDPGQRPSPQDDPLNAIVRRCTLKGASGGKLAGKRFGLKNRSIIREGNFADIVVFDPQTIRDRATYDDPHQISIGVEHVLVNGASIIEDGSPVEYQAAPLPGRYVKYQCDD